MPRRSLRVMPKQQSDALPEWANEYVVLVAKLDAIGALREGSERLRVARRDGYCGLDVFLFLLAYFCSGLRIGLRAFSQRCTPHGQQLAAVAGRCLWPGSSSVSRFLCTVDQEQAESFGEWLLGEGVDARAVESHPSIVCRDTRGEGWHMFDYDPTVTTLRHRALPVGDDLPEAVRRSANMAAKGYPGRKRGDVQFSRATLQHAGSGLWASLSMHPGNGAHRADNERAAASVKAWCERTGTEPEHAVLRCDGGAGGSIPAMTAYREAGIHFVTRLARYDLLDHEQVTEKLSRGSWFDVEDSLSGPKRQATELGTFRLSADSKTRREHGEPYESIETRVVVSRIRLTEDDEGAKRGAGLARDGWWYELFGTSLPATCWPAPETVSLYYGRCGQENRFCQEDRELGLDRIFSYHLPGQQLANLIGLFAWNLRTARGADLVAPMPDKLPTQTPRLSVPSSSPISPVTQGLPVEPEMTTVDSAPENPDTSASQVTPDTAGYPQGPDEHEEENTSNAEPCAARPATDLDALAEVNWDAHLTHLPGWRWEAGLGLVCSNDKPLRLHSVENTHHGNLLVRWRARAKACRECPQRPLCSNSRSTKFRKEVWIKLENDQSNGMATLAARAKPAPPAHWAKQQHAATAGARTPRRSTPGEDDPGDLNVSWPILVPSELRHHFRWACSAATVDVKLDAGTRRRARTPFYFATNSARRQRRRRTWTWRCGRNQLREHARVEIAVRGGHRLPVLLAECLPAPTPRNVAQHKWN